MNGAGPVFSVATPKRNALDKLKRCVGSVRGQARLALEHLVQDGCCVQDARQPCPMQLRWPAVPLARQRMAAKTCVSAKSKTHFVAPSRWMAAVARRSPVQWSAGPITLSIFGSVKRSTVKMNGLAVLSVRQPRDAESIAALYSASDVFVAASLQDNLPNIIMEAAACGVPTVAFDIGGISDLVEHGICGWLVAAGNSIGLVRAVMLAVSNPPLRLAAGRAAKRQAEPMYSYSKLAAAHMKLYSEAMLRNAA